MDIADTKKYYQMAKEASQRVGNHPGLLYLQEKSKRSSKILDVGCGEGTRLSALTVNTKAQGWGMEINKYAILLAKKQYPNLQFFFTEDEKLPFDSNKFDLVYSAFVLEHTQNPEKLVRQMIRVCTPGGLVVILCPNFGAPNRRSPVSNENPYNKFAQGLFAPRNITMWKKVTPKKHFDSPDDDSTIEPELLSLANFLKSQSLVIEKLSSVWEEEIPSLNPRKLIVYLLGKIGIPPFKWWGPQIFIAARKL